jgi:glutathione S-transferase
MFAALSTVEPPILELVTVRIIEADQLEDEGFTAGDLMMVSVLLTLRSSGLLDEFPTLAAFVARGEARPAYERAFAAQWAINDPQAS